MDILELEDMETETETPPKGEKKPKTEIKKICPICGKEFTAYHKRRMYCSDECKKKSIAQKAHAWRKAHPEHTAKYAERSRYRMREVRRAQKIEKQIDAEISRQNAQREYGGMTYAERQIAETLSMVPKIDTDISKFKKI